MVEPFIAGRELCVAVMGEPSGPRALAVTDIVSTTGFYDYEAKYGEGGSRHVVPAEIPAVAIDPRAPWTCRRGLTPPWVVAALADRTCVMTTLRAIWSYWRSTPSPA